MPSRSIRVVAGVSLSLWECERTWERCSVQHGAAALGQGFPCGIALCIWCTGASIHRLYSGTYTMPITFLVVSPELCLPADSGTGCLNLFNVACLFNVESDDSSVGDAYACSYVEDASNFLFFFYFCFFIM